jgi:hypothetical protein
VRAQGLGGAGQAAGAWRYFETPGKEIVRGGVLSS